MEPPVTLSPMIERDRDITATVLRERTNLGNFIRRRVRQEVRRSELPERAHFYVPSLSATTLVFKAMVMPQYLATFYPDLRDERLKSALVIFHQRDW